MKDKREVKPVSKTERTPEESRNSADLFDMRNPWWPFFWFMLLFIPAVLGIVYSLRQPETSRSPEPLRAPQTAESAQMAPAHDAAEQKRWQDLTNSRRNPVLTEESCAYGPWVGRRAEGEITEELKADKQSYRLLPPGSAMTMDHNPARVNLELNDQGIITRIWCG